MLNNVDVHSTLTLHRYRAAELYAEADRERLARAVRGGAGSDQPRWWSRARRRRRGATTRAPAMS